MAIYGDDKHTSNEKKATGSVRIKPNKLIGKRPNFNVTVEKNYYVSGTVGVEANSVEEAVANVKAEIESGTLQTNSDRITWNDDMDYIDGSFNTTGDVEEN